MALLSKAQQETSRRERYFFDEIPKRGMAAKEIGPLNPRPGGLQLDHASGGWDPSNVEPGLQRPILRSVSFCWIKPKTSFSHVWGEASAYIPNVFGTSACQVWSLPLVECLKGLLIRIPKFPPKDFGQFAGVKGSILGPPVVPFYILLPLLGGGFPY